MWEGREAQTLIQSVRIQNYQSLEDTTVELGTLTVILGPNDMGKSAFFRAVKAAAEAAAGSDFISYGHSKARVTIVFDGGRSLVWEKGDRVNRYVLDGVTFEKVGRQPPDEVAAALGLGSVVFDQNLELNLNFADQEDPPFLVPFPGGLSSSHVAKVLGDLTNLNLLYRAVALAENTRRRHEVDAKSHESELAQLENALALLDQPIELAELEALEGDLISVKEQDVALSRYVYARNERESFRSLYSELTEQMVADELAAVPDEVLTEAEALLDCALRLREAKAELTEKSTAQALLEGSLEDYEDEVREAELSLEEFKSTNKVCPLCEQPLGVAHDHQ